ncbi:hypothetical protein JOF56_011606 [Kibdelosporangium banguiense]|uniref:DUF7426 domain-containing protein n=1 Tax=Kibdelosporangium banguiense TaxID=1365924 RepID=A0ABS4U3J2_9PSEU|nr:hypothetical protein [Kibdelosporangium banguiense]MBP2331221.1 hypothetical protein [Kibdelosporangium banguiense]
MTTFPPLRRLQSEIDGATLDLPLRGKVYSFPMALPIRLGLKMTILQEEARRLEQAKKDGVEYEVKDEAREWIEDTRMHELFRELIGETMVARLTADGATWPELIHIGQTLFVFHQSGLEAALFVWQSGEDDEAAEGDARPPARKPATRSGSSRQTTSRTSSTRQKPAATKGARSGGATSSKRGS